MKNLITIIVLFLLIFSPVISYAQCENPRDDFDSLYCMNKIYVQADKDLNTSYKKLRKALDKEGKEILRTGQLKWIEERNDTCSFRKDGMFFVSLKCAADMTINRTNFLNDRYRECISSGCLKNRLQ